MLDLPSKGEQNREKLGTSKPTNHMKSIGKMNITATTLKIAKK